MNADQDFLEIEIALNNALYNEEIEPNNYQASAEQAMLSRGFVFDSKAGCTCPLDHNAEYGHHFSCAWVKW